MHIQLDIFLSLPSTQEHCFKDPGLVSEQHGVLLTKIEIRCPFITRLKTCIRILL